MPDTPDTWLSDFTVNLTTSDAQANPRVTQLANGNILVVWHSADQTGAGAEPGLDVIGQVFNPLGERVGGEVRLNSSSTDFDEAIPDVAALPDGGFLVAYRIATGGTFSVNLQRYDAFGTATDAEQVATDTTINAAPSNFPPRIAVSSATSALVVWEQSEVGGDSWVTGRIYNPTTGELGSEVSLINYQGTNSAPAVTVLNNGTYVIACATVETGGDQNITFRIVNPAGGNVRGATRVASTAGDGFNDREASVAALTGGGFVITWTNTDASDTDVLAQRFDLNGVAQGGVIVVSPGTNGNESVTVGLRDGGFLVIYDDDDATPALRGRRFDANGAVVGIEFTITDGALADVPDAELLDDGRVAVTFERADLEIGMVILDTRDAANVDGVYTPESWQIGTVGNDTITGDGFAFFVAGHDGDDQITTAGFAASYFGGAGNDTVIVTNLIDNDAHHGGAGNSDTIDWSGSGQFGGTFNLAAGTATDASDPDNILTEAMTGFERLVGTAQSDGITGTDDANELFGGFGDDSITGGLGNDFIEGGGDDDEIVGGDNNDTLNGETGNDRLFGGANDDNLVGDIGNDTLTGGDGTDQIFGGGGDDTFLSEGNGLSDQSFGSTGNDRFVLSGTLFSGAFDGGADSDTIDGSAIVTNATLTINLATESYSFGSVPFTLTATEHAIGGAGRDTITGSDRANSLSGGGDRDRLFGGGSGDTLLGGAGNDTLNGGSGVDELFGGADDDNLGTVSLVNGRDVLDGGTGIDRVRFDSASGVDVNLVLQEYFLGGAETPTAIFGVEQVTTGGGADTIRGSTQTTLINAGGGGDIVELTSFATVAIGGTGRDTLFLTGIGSPVLINLGTSLTHTGFEDLFLGDGDDDAVGTAGANVIDGGAGRDVLDGGGGNDTLIGGLGRDSLFGGNDSDDFGTITATTGFDDIDGGSGIDRVSFAGTTANMLFTQNFYSIGADDFGIIGLEDITSGSGNDIFTSVDAAVPTRIDAGGGDDTVVVQALTTTLIGGTGRDRLSFLLFNNTNLTINLGTDTLRTGWEDLSLGGGDDSGTGTATSNSLDGNAGNDTLIGLGGADALFGGADNDRLNGGLGNDTLLGGAGDDTYVVDVAGDRVFETTTTGSLIDAGGIDTVQSAVSFNLDASAGVRFVERLTLSGTDDINAIGNALANRLTGNAGDNRLTGRLGDDTMLGGAGNDTYVVNGIGDRVFETTTTASLIDAGGIDTVDSSVSFSLAASVGLRFVEHLTLTGGANTTATGNALANRLTGNAGHNVLNGRLGSDTMLGGAGNDTYVVDASGDRVFETTTTASAIDAGGIDTVQSAVTFSLAASAGVRFVEHLTLTGGANTTATGNALANRLTGNAGNNGLNGRLGDDTMLGGAGNDTYVVNGIGDRVFETTTTASLIDAGGIDTVDSSVTFSLDASPGLRFVEHLTLTGGANTTATGNALANRLTGNAGNNALNGRLGNDTMAGGAGSDVFIFNTAPGGGNIDRITDFDVVDDTIRLDDAVFAGLTTGLLAASAFSANLTGAASAPLHRIIYETDTGRVYFDADGTGLGLRVHFATLSANLALTNADFFVF